MRRVAGQIVRLIGLALEALGLLAQGFKTQTDDAGLPLPGNFSSHQVWTVVGVGFVMWLTGTLLIYWPPFPRSRRSGPEPHRGGLRL